MHTALLVLMALLVVAGWFCAWLCTRTDSKRTAWTGVALMLSSFIISLFI